MKKKIVYKCNKCDHISQGYFGKCPSCGAWNSLEEYKEEKTISKNTLEKKKSARKLKDVYISSEDRIQTSIEEFNRVMGGGIVRDSVSILTAKPGAGKSTLLLQVANDLAKSGIKVLYASGEESETQIRSRAARVLNELSENIWVYSTTSMDFVLEEIEEINPEFIIIDSIQTFSLAEFPSRPASPTQTMECAHKMVEVAKNADFPRIVFIVGQMTKQDELAGLRQLEHLVDTVLVIEGDSNLELRSLLTTKNRYGSTGEIGFFVMEENGMVSLDNPSLYFMTLRSDKELAAGSSLSVIREGTRPIILETEALVSKSFMPYPSRISENIGRENLNTLVSILEERAGIRLIDKNIVVKTTGSIRLKEVASNLSVMMSIVSSVLNKPINIDTVFIADVGLTGELKNVPAMETRLREADRMGFKKAYIAKNGFNKKLNLKNIEIIEKNNINAVISEVFR